VERGDCRRRGISTSWLLECSARSTRRSTSADGRSRPWARRRTSLVRGGRPGLQAGDLRLTHAHPVTQGLTGNSSSLAPPGPARRRRARPSRRRSPASRSPNSPPSCFRGGPVRHPPDSPRPEVRRDFDELLAGGQIHTRRFRARHDITLDDVGVAGRAVDGGAASPPAKAW